MTCRCGCDAVIPADKVWVPGHDLRAAQAVIKEHYGSVEAFVEYHENPPESRDPNDQIPLGHDYGL